MEPADKEFARDALQRRWMTIEQVEKCRVLAAQNGTSLRAVADTYGYVPPTRRSPIPFTVGLGVTLFIFAMGSLLIMIRASRQAHDRDLDLAREEARLHAQPLPQRKPDTVRDDIDAEKRLQSGRAGLRFVEENLDKLLETERIGRLEEAIDDFTQYLKHRPDYAPVLLDRARAHDMLGRLPEAIADYEASARADATYKKMVFDRVAELKQLLK